MTASFADGLYTLEYDQLVPSAFLQKIYESRYNGFLNPIRSGKFCFFRREKGGFHNFLNTQLKEMKFCTVIKLITSIILNCSNVN